MRDSIFCSRLLHKSSVLLASVDGGRGMPRPEINRVRNNCMEVYIIKKQNGSWVSLSNVLMDFQWKTIYKV